MEYNNQNNFNNFQNNEQQQNNPFPKKTKIIRWEESYLITNDVVDNNQSNNIQQDYNNQNIQQNNNGSFNR